jgi:hypothetical protein
MQPLWFLDEHIYQAEWQITHEGREGKVGRDRESSWRRSHLEGRSKIVL